MLLKYLEDPEITISHIYLHNEITCRTLPFLFGRIFLLFLTKFVCQPKKK